MPEQHTRYPQDGESQETHRPGTQEIPPGKQVKEPTAQSNPFYGCAILLIAICTFGFIITWTLYSGYKQSSEIDAFTVPDPPALPAIVVSESDRNILEMGLGAFADVAKSGRPVAITLTVEDLNAIILLAGEAGVADYRGMVRFTGIDATTQVLKADIRWKMNNLPLVQAPDRYLAGHATFKPVIENNALELHIENLEVPGKTVSEGFLRQLRTWPWLNLAKLKPEVKEPLSKITRFDFSADGSIFALHCGETVPK